MHADSEPGFGSEPPFIKMMRAGNLLAVHTRYEGPGGPYLVPNFGSDAAIMATIHMRSMERAELWRNGRSLGEISSRPGELQLYDLRHRWRSVLHPPFETVNIQITLQMLEAAAGGTHGRMIFEPPAIEPGRVDEVMLNIARAMLPAFTQPTEVTALFAEHLALAAAAHLVSRYARDDRVLPRPKQGLAPWQQRRAADMMLDQLDGDATLSAIAVACGLSAGHFSKAFRLSFGMPPHRWLLRERVRRASEMMTATSHPLNEIAVACGFVDQSHLSRVFRRVMGLPPAAWRRARSSR